ncbi:unnamed protein product [Chironomus riparius]|uniref:Uncharacterized protein n=1 Tax=Chironomus riparius TaxID=315576 RepID=A0A9N9S3L0_9DIPT|nr:unnamed protein product [Chironomus riparius]
MNQLKIFIISCLIYQTMAGGPATDCVTCAAVLLNAVAPSPETCYSDGLPKIDIRVSFNIDRPDESGVCIKPLLPFSSSEINSDIDHFISAEIRFDSA